MRLPFVITALLLPVAVQASSLECQAIGEAVFELYHEGVPQSQVVDRITGQMPDQARPIVINAIAKVYSDYFYTATEAGVHFCTVTQPEPKPIQYTDEFHECILDNMKDAQNKTAAQMIRRSCYELYN